MYKFIAGLVMAAVTLLPAVKSHAATTAGTVADTTEQPQKAQKAVVTGAERTSAYLKLLKGKRVALFSNQTGVVGDKHVLDVLLDNGVNVVTIFSPEHGFRGKADAGEKVSSSVDEKTGVAIYSLYGVKGGAPDDATMEKFDVLVSDIQDVGLRFYTYYVTMVRLMDRCAEFGKQMIVLDRPNPNGMYVDGPTLDMKFKSGVGSLPIPVVHGMTLGELALMVNGEGWLKNRRKCRLKVVTCQNYTHQTRYTLPVAPSPNLPNMTSIYLYPSLCYFEATDVSLGRGTDKPFQQYGHPDMKGFAYTFTPESREGAKTPPQLGNTCYGRDLSSMSDDDIIARQLDLTYLIEAYRSLAIGDKFFTPFFEKLIGVDWVRTMIEDGSSADEIRQRWAPDVERFKKQRKPYLLYKE